MSKANRQEEEEEEEEEENEEAEEAWLPRTKLVTECASAVLQCEQSTPPTAVLNVSTAHFAHTPPFGPVLSGVAGDDAVVRVS